MDEYSYPLHMLGTATPLHEEPKDDTISRLHAVVLEITGKPVETPPPRRIGFLSWSSDV